MDEREELESVEALTFEQAWAQFEEEPRHPKSVALAIKRKRMFWGGCGLALLAFTLVMYGVGDPELGGMGHLGVCTMIGLVIWWRGDKSRWARIQASTNLVWAQAPERALGVLQNSRRFATVMEQRAREDEQDEFKGKVVFFGVTAVLGLGVYGVAQVLWPDIPPGLTGLMVGLAGLVGAVSLLLTGFLSIFVLVSKASRREEDIEMKQLKAISEEIFSGDVTGGLSVKEDDSLRGALGVSDSEDNHR